MPHETGDSGNISRKKRFFYLVSFVVGLLGIIIVVQSFSSENIWRKDFLQVYLTARAVLLKMDPYLPVFTLADIQGYSLPHGAFLNPSPHTPVLMTLTVPYAWFPYTVSAILNLVLEICCLVFSVTCITQWLGLRMTPLMTLATVWLCFGLGAVWESLALGQINLTLAALLIVGLWGLTTGRDTIGGIAVGSVISMKLIFWPLLVLLAVYRKGKACTAVFGTIILLNLFAGLVLGFNTIEKYYLYAAPAVASLYRSFSGNLSLWSVGWKLFEGTGSTALVGITAPPLIALPHLAPFFSYGLTALLFCIALFLSLKVKNFEAAYGIMISFSLLMSPLCWSHYLVVTAIPFACVARRVFGGHSTVRGRIALYLTSACLLVPGPILAVMQRWFQAHSPFDTPLLLLAVSLIPMYGVLSCALLCYFFSRGDNGLSVGFARQGEG